MANAVIDKINAFVDDQLQDGCLKISALYSFNNGFARLAENSIEDLFQLLEIICSIPVETKYSKERKRNVYDQGKINDKFKELFKPLGWESQNRIFTTNFDGEGVHLIFPQENDMIPIRGRREMDFLIPGSDIGIEVQFGKYAFGIFDILSKMSIFGQNDYIQYGIEIVATRNMAKDMNTSVATFENIVWDLGVRGVSDKDIPVLVIGIDVSGDIL